MLLHCDNYAFTLQYLCYCKVMYFRFEPEATGEDLLFCVAVGISDLVLP